MPEKYIIDRIENNIAICQDHENQEKIIDIPLEVLPKEAKEGSFLTYENGMYSIDIEAESQARTRIRSKMDKLFNR